jgi:hypothetical protein
MTQAFNLSQLANNLNTNGQLDATDGLTGLVPIANGGVGTNTAPTNGRLLIGNSSGGYTVANLTAGSNITITNASGGITIASNATVPVYSSQFAFPNSDTNLSWNHGLGTTPRRFGAFCVLTAFTAGTPVGTVFAITSSDGDGGRQNMVYANSTVVGWVGVQPIYTGFSTEDFTVNSSNSNIYFWAEL